jgi:hypothetical protein
MCSAAQRRGAPRRRVADPVCRQLGKAELPLCMCLMTADRLIGRQLCLGRNRHSRLPQQWSAGVMAGAGGARAPQHTGRTRPGQTAVLLIQDALQHSASFLRNILLLPSRRRASGGPFGEHAARWRQSGRITFLIRGRRSFARCTTTPATIRDYLKCGAGACGPRRRTSSMARAIWPGPTQPQSVKRRFCAPLYRIKAPTERQQRSEAQLRGPP